MPESRTRKRPAYTPPAPGQAQTVKPNPRWLVPVMVGLMVLGLAWVVVTYLAEGAYPIPGIHNWNLGIGFACIIGGFALTTRWR